MSVSPAPVSSGGSDQPGKPHEQKCGQTHVQFFIGEICIATVRTEYAQAFREAVEKCATVANKTVIS